MTVIKLCEACGEAIPAKRLAVIPTAKFCVPCIENGDADDVFTYRAKVVEDEEGNFHSAIVSTEEEWEAAEEELDIIKGS